MTTRSTAAKREDSLEPSTIKTKSKPVAVPRPGRIHEEDGFDRLIYERVRLGIMSALATNEALTFNELKALFNVSDGNLGAHARKLEEAGYIACNKSFEGRPEVRIPDHVGRPQGAAALPGAHRGRHQGDPQELIHSFLVAFDSTTQSYLQSLMHVAIIMDGNGRWATQRGLPRTAGHIEGAKAVRGAVETAARAGLDTLTLYAFSAANWARPATEIAALMKLFGQYLFSETRRCVEQSIRVNVIGRRDRLSENLLRSIEQSERLSASCTGMHLRIAVDYSSQYSILRAAEAAARRALDGPADGAFDPDEFERCLQAVDHSAAAAGPVDLLIRTGNERRLSDFLLWECAFAELYFPDCLWPDFDEARFRAALGDYAGRQRRFGGLSAKGGEPG